MLFLILMFVLLVILLMLLYLRVMQDKRVKLARSEMPGKVSIWKTKTTHFLHSPREDD